jgi:hypothetical protein
MNRFKYVNKDEDLSNYINDDELVKVVYGINFARSFLEENFMKVNFFCDRKAESINSINGIPVVTKYALNEYLNGEGKRAFIIICIGPNKAVSLSIYKELCMIDMDAIVADYFDNIRLFTCRSFNIKEYKFDLFEHVFNCGFCNTRMTERSVEIALAIKYIGDVQGDIIEVGAVTPYYQLPMNNKIKHTIDPTDLHVKVDIRKSLFDYDFSNENVLSI